MTSPRLWRSSPTLEGCSIWWLKDYELQMQIWSQSFALLYYYMISSHSWVHLENFSSVGTGWWFGLKWIFHGRHQTARIPTVQWCRGGAWEVLKNPKWFLQLKCPPGRVGSYPIRCCWDKDSQPKWTPSNNAKGGALQKAPGAWVNWQMIHMDFQGWTFEGPEAPQLQPERFP